MRRFLAVAAGIALVAAIVTPAALAQFAPVTPESPNADGIRRSYLFVTIFTFAIFLLVEGLLIASVVRYRRNKRARMWSIATTPFGYSYCQ